MPPSWPMIVGIAVPTTVESSAATAMPAITPALMSSCSRVMGRSAEGIGRFYAGCLSGWLVTSQVALTGDSRDATILRHRRRQHGPIRSRGLADPLPHRLEER